MRDEILEHMHNTPTAGHPGETRLLALLKSRFYWPLMKISVKNWVSKCHDCSTVKSRQEKAAKLVQYHVGDTLERVQTDITGLFPLQIEVIIIF